MKELKGIEEFRIGETLMRGRRYRDEGKYDLSLKEFNRIFSGIPEDANPFLHNLILNELETLKGTTHLESRPRGLGIALTNRCNIRCIMCNVWKDPWDIPEKTIREITELLPYLERIFWQGGEVFLSPYFEELLDRISAFPNIRQDINTNGLLMDENWARKLVKVNANVIFSIDGITKETYEYIRKGAKFEDLLRNIELFNEHVESSKGETKDNGGRCSTIINLVLMKSNYQELGGFIDFAKKYKFERLQVTPVDIDNDENIFLYKNKEALAFIERVMPGILEKAKSYGISVSNWLPAIEDHPSCCDEVVSSQKEQRIDSSKANHITTETNNRLSCFWPWQFLFIDWGGRVRPQCFCIKPVGNILKNTIEEIWNTEIMKMYRQKLFNNDCQDWCDKRCVSGRMPKESLGLDSNYFDGIYYKNR